MKQQNSIRHNFTIFLFLIILFLINKVNGKPAPNSTTTTINSSNINLTSTTPLIKPLLVSKFPILRFPLFDNAPIFVGKPQQNTSDIEFQPFQFVPETKDELFARIDTDKDGTISFEDYIKRDRFYVESVRDEFEQIDENKDSKISKKELEDYIEELENQQKLSFLRASNFTLQKYDLDKDNALKEEEFADYINGTLQRSIERLHEVFEQFDTDKNKKMDLEEFCKLDLHFPWDKFPLKEITLKQQVGFDAVSHVT